MAEIWHPFWQHGLKEPIFEIACTQDEFLITNTGKKIIDGISSWWVNNLGHNNPYITDAIKKQACIMQQIIFAGFTHKPAIETAEKLSRFLPSKFSRIFYSDSGSICVEVGLKMAVGYYYNKFGKNKSKIVAMEHSYHGDTFGGMSSGAKSVFNRPYEKMLFDVIHIPYPIKGREEITIKEYEKILKSNADKIGAIVLEPLVLGSGGMLFYEPFILDELYRLSKEYDVMFVLDEVMTGFGRTGTMFAFEQSNITPDIICLSKGLTGGTVPLAATLCTEEIYNAFYGQDKSKMFFHSSSYTANPISLAAASAALDLWKDKKPLNDVKRINNYYKAHVKNFSNARILGGIFAFETDGAKNDYTANIAVKLYRYFLENDVLLRPLGNTVYVMPPYCIKEESLDKIFALLENIA
ncbi:MAG: adenosylmethionine--8-amino-7-oxononanoate transaminase [Candidatus Gastranaerophilales bacterium]|nr:adenosylmethionine--8-amino-7-oxononanoate transaminase [Candidatus Gastranaerophilales bacterium]